MKFNFEFLYQPVLDAVHRLQKELIDIGNEAFREAAENIVTEMKVPGAPPTYPIHWASAKQRRAFFATNGFGGGIPYRRTGGYQRGWKAVPVAHGYAVSHPWRGATFISGNARGYGQSPIHKGRWNKLSDAVGKAKQTLPIVIRIAYHRFLTIVIGEQKNAPRK